MRLLGLILFVLLLSSCYREVSENFEVYEPKLVINSLFSPDSVFTVYVAKTRSFNDNLPTDTILWVNDAICSLSVDDSFLEILQNISNGKYISSSGYKPQVGRHYSIKVFHNQLGKIEAQSYVPRPPRLLYFSKQDTAVYVPDLVDFDIPDGIPPKMGLITLRFASNQGNYFQILARQTYAGYQRFGCFSCNYDTLIIDKRLVYLLLPSQQENLTPYNLSILVENHDSVVALELLSQEMFLTFTDYLFKNMTLEVRSLSEQMYLYYKSLSKQSESSVLGNYEPVSYYSNVSGGYGIFAGYSSVVDSTTYPVSLDTVVFNHLEDWQYF